MGYVSPQFQLGLIFLFEIGNHIERIIFLKNHIDGIITWILGILPK